MMFCCLEKWLFTVWLNAVVHAWPIAASNVSGVDFIMRKKHLLMYTIDVCKTRLMSLILYGYCPIYYKLLMNEIVC